MKKILFFLCFTTLSLHARLEVSFKVTGSEAKYLKVCLGNEHSSGKHVCGMGSAARHYDNKDITAQVLHVEWKKSLNQIQWGRPFPPRVSVQPQPKYVIVRPPNLVYKPKGTNGQVSITAKISVNYSKRFYPPKHKAVDVAFVGVYDMNINDTSK